MVHWRLFVGAGIGVIAWGAASLLHAPFAARALIGWNAGAAVYVAAMWILFLNSPDCEARQRSAREDETRSVILLLVMAAIGASLAAILAALIMVKGESAGARLLVTVLAALTLLTSWVMLQTTFIVHYAHRHFQAVEIGGDKAGFLFPGEAPRGYLDFAYLAICVGATAQISDPSVPTTRLRNLVTAHAVVSFFYNTAVLALGINIISGLIGH